MNQRKIAMHWIVAPGLLVLAAISYGVLISKLGFYWDDWTIAWYIHFLGPESFKEAYALDRPLLASIYQLTTPLLGHFTIELAGLRHCDTLAYGYHTVVGDYPASGLGNLSKPPQSPCFSCSIQAFNSSISQSRMEMHLLSSRYISYHGDC